MNKPLLFLAVASFLILASCQDKKEEQTAPEVALIEEEANTPAEKQPDFILSPDHQTNSIMLDIDGDGQPDHIEIVKSTVDNQYGITVKRGNGAFDIIGPLVGSTHRALPEDMEDLIWAQDVYVADKHTVIYEVTDENGDLRSEEDVPEDEKTTLPYESLHLSVPESCGSGLLYWLDGTYYWHQTS